MIFEETFLCPFEVDSGALIYSKRDLTVITGGLRFFSMGGMHFS